MNCKESISADGAKVIRLTERTDRVQDDKYNASGQLMASYLAFSSLDQMLDDHFREMEEFGE